ncbi:CRP-like cAMP-binding protein [Methylobacterium sp. BE186]|uniref:Crp/Fnr family transcriptional regulator n=1 Tax=Methylobacterium sp. BE186 TaxID=2817715 RepID=UPI0028669003|nr:Crp/Fnr family transcriptional regulator [Methylobacterium sp. BE186]MDR7037791.1 CRP-like cAMP-binding protein [Methylobacterium sp. BE186]
MRDLQPAIAASSIRWTDEEAGSRNPLIRKLERFVPLSEDDRAALEWVCSSPRSVEPHLDLAREGSVPEDAIVVLGGFACRYTLRQNGARQILAYLLPGDLCDADLPNLGRMDHAIGTLSTCMVVRVPRETLVSLTEHHPNVARALRLAKLAEEATARAWIVSLGCRSATERLTHLFCELRTRLEAVGLVREGWHPLPLTQVDLADTLGLSNVHVNRVLQNLRRKGLILLKGRSLKLLDLEGLRAVAEFSPRYLQAGPRQNGQALL